METLFRKAVDISGAEERETLLLAGKILREGGLVVFPTETVYGLGADALNPLAAQKIYAAKGRPSDNPLIVHIADPSEAEGLVHTSALYYKLARAFMPGPLTVIMPKKECIPKEVTAGLDTVAIRCPQHPVARELIACAGVPVAAPSANLSGSPSPTDASHVKDDMKGRVDMIIDGGACEVGLESTIVKIESESELTLLRPGAVTKEDLEALNVKVTVASAVLGALKEGETVLSPGMKYRHYAPRAPLLLLEGTALERENFLKEREGKIAYLGYDEEREVLSSLPLRFYAMGGEADTKKQASLLFSLLREADKEDYDVIYAPAPAPTGMGMALYNRMIRAAAHQIIHLGDNK